jgi:hypothetical protein
MKHVDAQTDIPVIIRILSPVVVEYVFLIFQKLQVVFIPHEEEVYFDEPCVAVVHARIFLILKQIFENVISSFLLLLRQMVPIFILGEIYGK